MTDNEIIKALECCSTQDGCKSCIFYEDCVSPIEKAELIMKNALDLINRLKAENERLEKVRKDEVEKLMSAIDRTIAEAKAEAYKEFAERLKEKTYTYSDITGYQSTVVDVNEIDGVYEEMVGEE